MSAAETDILTVQEKYSRHWPAVVRGSAVLAVATGIAWLLVSDVLIAGYLRLAAFCFFALALLAFFKVRQGRVTIHIQASGNNLELEYMIRDSRSGRGTHDMLAFADVEIVEMPNRSLANDLAAGERTIRIRERESKEWYYLLRLQDRVLPLEPADAEKVAGFIERHRRNPV